MPSGDAQRVWFPEVLEELKTAWSSSMTWGELADFCERMTEKRRAIREARGILPPRTRCPRCGAVSLGPAPRLEALTDPDANPMMPKAETHARATAPRLRASTFPRRRVTVARNERVCARRS